MPLWLLIDPEILAAVLVGLGLVIGVKYFSQMFGHALGDAGIWGRIVQFIAGPVATRIENAISHWVGNLIQPVDHAVGTTFHAVARVLDWTGDTLVDGSGFALSVAGALGDAASLSDVRRALQEALGAIHTVEHDAEVALRRAEAAEKAAVHSVAQGVYPRLRTLEHEVTREIPREIKSARDLARSAEDGVIRLWQKVRSLPTTADIVTAVAAAIAALGLSGLDLLKCSEAGSMFNRRGCGLWNALEDVLALLADAVIFFDLCNVLPELTSLFSDFEEPLTALISDAANAACAHPPAGWGPLPAQSLYLPSSPSLALHLP